TCWIVSSASSVVMLMGTTVPNLKRVKSSLAHAQVRTAAGGKPVADVETDGQAQALELAHPALETRHVEADVGGQAGCADRRVAADHRQVLPCPRFGGRIPAVQPRGDRVDVFVAEFVVGGEFRALV